MNKQFEEKICSFIFSLVQDEEKKKVLTHGDNSCFCHSSNYTKMNILNYLCFCHWFCKMKWLVSRLDMICIKLDYHEASIGKQKNFDPSNLQRASMGKQKPNKLHDCLIHMLPQVGIPHSRQLQPVPFLLVPFHRKEDNFCSNSVIVLLGRINTFDQ